MKKIAFIGAGNMNSAIISGLIQNGYCADNIIVSNPSAEKRLTLQENYGIKQTKNNIEAAQFADVIVLGIKPYLILEVCQQLTKAIDISKKVFISVAAGCPLEKIECALEKPCTVFRTMPNTPAQLGVGVTGIFANTKATEQEKIFTEKLMSSVGVVKRLDNEGDIDHIIAVSGSGPAYFFLFMEAMEKQAKAYGFNDQDSRELVQQTALGAAKMVVENPQLSISTLRENVTSKGGTTQAAINTFNHGNLELIVTKAMNSAVERAKEMAQDS